MRTACASSTAATPGPCSCALQGDCYCVCVCMCVLSQGRLEMWVPCVCFSITCTCQPIPHPPHHAEPPHPPQKTSPRSSTPSIDPLSAAATASLVPFWVVGNEGGFWPRLSPPMTTLQAGPAERFDLVLDLSGGSQLGCLVIALHRLPVLGWHLGTPWLVY
jgi:hypothetical protein